MPRVRRKERFNPYIYKVLKQVHPDQGLTKKTMEIMNDFMNDIFDRLAIQAGKLVKQTKRQTMNNNDVRAAVRLILPGELAKHAVSECTKANVKYEQSMNATPAGQKRLKAMNESEQRRQQKKKKNK
jgi:histone H2B